jgi:hypothetical protein
MLSAIIIKKYLRLLKLNIFIVGMEKASTTALAGWITKNYFANLMVSGVKEPFTYADPYFNISKIETKNNSNLLDASVGYALNNDALERLPKKNSHIIICLRNQFSRVWSSYKMKKIAISDSVNAGVLLNRFFNSDLDSQKKTLDHFDSISLFDLLKAIEKKHRPREEHLYFDRYFDLEAKNFSHLSFEERINYETAFKLKRNKYPHLSILNQSFYSEVLKNLMAKFTKDQITFVSVGKIGHIEELRRAFLMRVFKINEASLSIDQIFSSEDIHFNEEKPNFYDVKWDSLRSSFIKDLTTFESQMAYHQLNDEFIDKGDLAKFLFD